MLIQRKYIKGMAFSLLSTTLLLSACNSSTTNSSTKENDKGSQNIKVSYMKSGTYDKAAEDIAQKMSSQGLSVKVDAFPWAALRQKNTTDIISGNNNYDVMSGGYYLADVYPNFSSLKTNMEKSQYGKGMIPGILDKSQKFNGEPIGAPYGVDAYGIIYRTDLFEQAGIPLPKTWEEFNSALTTLKQKLPQGVEAYAFSAGANDQLPDIFFPRYAGTYINKDGKYQLEKDKAIKAIENAQFAIKQGPSNITGLSIDQVNAMFLQGKVAVIEGWPSFIASMAVDSTKSKVVGKWGVAPYPEGGFPDLSLWNLYIPKKSKHPDAAWKWVDTFTNEQNSTENFIKYGIGSVYTSSYSDPKVVEKYGKAYLDGEQNNVQHAKVPPLAGQAIDALGQNLGDVFTGKISPEKAVEQINQSWASIPVPAALSDQAKQDNLHK